MVMKFETDQIAGRQRARAPGWMYFIAGIFITYYVVMCYSELYEPRRIGIDCEFKDGTMAITSVVQRSPAARAGIQAGDRLLAIDESGIRDWEDWRRFVATVETGRDYRFELERAGQRSEFSVKPGRQPGVEDPSVARVFLGSTPFPSMANDSFTRSPPSRLRQGGCNSAESSRFISRTSASIRRAGALPPSGSTLRHQSPPHWETQSLHLAHASPSVAPLVLLRWLKIARSPRRPFIITFQPRMI